MYVVQANLKSWLTDHSIQDALQRFLVALKTLPVRWEGKEVEQGSSESGSEDDALAPGETIISNCNKQYCLGNIQPCSEASTGWQSGDLIIQIGGLHLHYHSPCIHMPG